MKIKKAPPKNATVKIRKNKNKKNFFIFLKIFSDLEFREDELKLRGEIFFTEGVDRENSIDGVIFGGRVFFGFTVKGFFSGIIFFLLRLSIVSINNLLEDGLILAQKERSFQKGDQKILCFSGLFLIFD
ncbi:MAG: hypothetical protein V3574_05325 [Candidatus Moraniibacteriota bacterium]